jgi:signal transduction histidine kinase
MRFSTNMRFGINMGLGINKKVGLLSASLILFLVSFLSIYFIRQETAALSSELNERGALLLNGVCMNAELPLLAQDRDEVARIATGALTQKDIVYCRVEDVAGVVLFERGTLEAKHTRRFEAPVVTRMVAEAEGIFLGSAAHTREEVGRIVLGVSLAGLNRKVAGVTNTVLILAVVTILLMSVASSMLFRFLLTRPIAALVTGTERIASGDLEYKVRVRKNDEFGRLACAFNDMTANLSKTLVSKDALARQAETLAIANAELEKANAELQQLDRLKSDFISNVSHELRTPLTAIKAYAETLQSHSSLCKARRTGFLSIIVEQTDRLTNVIEDLLDISRIEAGKLRMSLEPVNLGEAIDSAMEDVLPIAKKKGVRMETQPLPEKCVVLADRHRLIQVLVNLLNNGVKFTGNGGIVTLSSAVRDMTAGATGTTGAAAAVAPGAPGEGIEREAPAGAGARQRYLQLTVSDNGIGIPQGELGKIFDRFKQVEDVARGKPSGTGLGLSICRELVERMGGTVWAESEEGVGSRFHFTLPLVNETEGEIPGPRDRTAAGTGPHVTAHARQRTLHKAYV